MVARPPSSPSPDATAPSDRPIAIYLPEPTPGGAQRVTIDLANGLAERGHAVDLLLSYPEGPLRESIDDAVRVVDFDTRPVPGVGIGASVPALVRYLRRTRPRILFSAMTYANVVATVAARLSLSGTPVAVVEHTTVGMERGGKRDLTNRLAWAVYGLADRVVAVSQGVADSVVAGTLADPDDVVVLHNPVPVAALRQRATAPVDHPFLADPDLDVVLAVGRLEPEKDLGTLLRAFQRVHAQRPSARLVVAGTGSQRERLGDLVDRLGLADVVSFPGFVDPAPYAARADVFALSSVFEGLPTVLVEALAVGCPVVSTDCPSGPREILADGEYGRLVPVGDDVALADAILATLATPPDSSRLRERADDFAPGPTLSAYERFVDAVGRR